MKEKIGYLDGLRGLAALIVVIHHYILAFYPRLFFDGANTYTNYDNLISKSPLNIIFNGNFSVSIFFVLSGFVLSYNFFQTRDLNSVIPAATKRYFRLLFPVFTSVVIAFVFMQLDLFSNKEVSTVTGSSMWLLPIWNFEPDTIDMLKQGLYGVFINGESNYNTNLWTMQIEFYGSLLIYSFLCFFGNLRKRYLIYIVLFLVLYKSYYLAFLFGLILSDLKNVSYNKNIFIKNKFLLFLLFCLSLYLGSYPYGDTENTIYKNLAIPNLNVSFYQFYHIIGGFLILYVLLSSKLMQNILSNKLMLFFGKISFSLYILHLIILCSFSTSFFNLSLSYFSYKTSFIVTLLISFILLIPISYFSYKYIDKSSIQVAKNVYNYLKGDSKLFRNSDKQVS